MGRLWGPCPQAWHGAGVGWPGKDIDEDLTGSIPQLSVGVDTPEQRLPQGLSRVGPQLPAGSGQGQHGSADGLLLWDPVGMGARVRVCAAPCAYPPWAMYTQCRENPGFEGGPPRGCPLHSQHSTKKRVGHVRVRGPPPCPGSPGGHCICFHGPESPGSTEGLVGGGGPGMEQGGHLKNS